MKLFALHFGHFTEMMPFAGRTEKQEKQESRGAAFAEKKSHLPEHSSFYLAARARAKRKRVHPATGSGDDLVAQTGVAY